MSEHSITFICFTAFILIMIGVGFVSVVSANIKESREAKKKDEENKKDSEDKK